MQPTIEESPPPAVLAQAQLKPLPTIRRSSSHLSTPAAALPVVRSNSATTLDDAAPQRIVPKRAASVSTFPVGARRPSSEASTRATSPSVHLNQQNMSPAPQRAAANSPRPVESPRPPTTEEPAVPKGMIQESMLILARLYRPFDYLPSHRFYWLCLERYVDSSKMSEVSDVALCS